MRKCVFVSNDETGQLVKQLPCIAEMCDAIHSLPRDLIGVNHLHKQHLTAGEKTKLFFNHYMTEAADSHSLTNCVFENNAVSSHSLCAAQSFSAAWPRQREAQAWRGESNSDALTKTGRQSPFIRIYTLMIV